MTINVRVRDLRNLFDWLQRSEKLPVGHLYWDDLHRSEGNEDERDKKQPWTVEEAEHLFRLPMWTGCSSLTKQGRKRAGDLVVHDAAYWVPLIAWYSGVRREEVCKLRLDEVDIEAGIPFFRVQPSKEGPIKTARAKRFVPLHSELLRLGFADYVEALSRAGEELLFPELRPGVEPRSKTHPETGRPMLERKRGDVFYDIWWTHMMKLAFPNGIDRDLHSFRHAFADAIEDCEDKVANDLLGHKSGQLRHDRYGSASAMEKLHAAVEQVPTVTQHLNPEPTRS